jgi:hypothetical protein
MVSRSTAFDQSKLHARRWILEVRVQNRRKLHEFSAYRLPMLAKSCCFLEREGGAIPLRAARAMLT